MDLSQNKNTKNVNFKMWQFLFIRVSGKFNLHSLIGIKKSEYSLDLLIFLTRKLWL